MSSRDKRALANKSRHGRDLQYGSWIHAEFEIMRMLYEAGADVPEVLRSSGAILMEYLGDEDAAAPMLSRVTLPREQAEQFLRRIIDNVTLWLAQSSGARRLVAIQPPLLGGTNRRDRFSASARRAD